MIAVPSLSAVSCNNVGNVELCTSKCVFKWEIPNFSNYCTMQRTDEYIHSRMFSFTGPKYMYQWKLNLHTMGDNQIKNQEYISLYLKSLNAVDVKAEFTFIILDSNKNKVAHSVGPWKTIFTPSEKNSWGTGNFITKNILMDKTKGMLTDDKLTIICEINTTAEGFNIDNNELLLKKPVNSYKLEVSDNFEKLLNNEKHSDVTFIVGDKSLHAHKSVLSSRSLVFAAMFDHDMKENAKNNVEIEDIDYTILKEMFRFIYSGKVQNIETIAEDLLVTADKYALGGLKAMCEESLCKCVSLENALEYLSIADLHNADKLKFQTKQFIAAHAKEIVVKPEFQAVGRMHTDLIVEVCCALCNLWQKTS